MTILLHGLVSLVAGAFFCNSIPHLAAGLRGEPFPTPFARPPGEGHSSSVVNFLWGAANLAAGAVLTAVVSFHLGINVESAAFFVGFIAIGAPMCGISSASALSVSTIPANNRERMLRKEVIAALQCALHRMNPLRRLGGVRVGQVAGKRCHRGLRA